MEHITSRAILDLYCSVYAFLGLKNHVLYPTVIRCLVLESMAVKDTCSIFYVLLKNMRKHEEVQLLVADVIGLLTLIRHRKKQHIDLYHILASFVIDWWNIREIDGWPASIVGTWGSKGIDIGMISYPPQSVSPNAVSTLIDVILPYERRSINK